MTGGKHACTKNGAKRLEMGFVGFFIMTALNHAKRFGVLDRIV